MAASFVHTQTFDAEIAAKAQGHVFAAGTKPWLG